MGADGRKGMEKGKMRKEKNVATDGRQDKGKGRGMEKDGWVRTGGKDKKREIPASIQLNRAAPAKLIRYCRLG